MLDATVRDAFAEELARRRLLDFARRTNARFESPTHIEYLVDLLERVERGEIKRLAISAPPGHGKSTLLQAFLAWFIGRDPRRRVLAISASESLAKRNSRDAQGLVTADTWPFIDVSLVADSVLEWHLSAGGSVRAIGKGGVISGFRAELAIIDDLQADAGSEMTRQTDFEWFQGVLSTRLEPGGAAVIIQTRWHDVDIIGQLKQSEAASQWTFVNLPAIATENDPLGREQGAALWPTRWPLSKLQEQRAEVGSNVFSALYQGDPVPAGGAIFAPEWFEHRFDQVPKIERIHKRSDGFRITESTLLSPPIVIQAVDSAWKTGLSNDRTCIATLASDLLDVYVVDVWFGRVLFPDLKRVAIDLYEKHRPSRLYVEEAASGFALVGDLRASTGIPIIGVPPGRESKEARAESVTGWFESGRVKFPRHATWMDELLAEFLRFPHGRHDDIVDAVTLGVRMMQHAVAQLRADERYEQNQRVMRHFMDR